MDPARGEVWQVDLNPPGKGHEQHGIRPALVISVDEFNSGPADLVVTVPLTSKPEGIAFHVEIKPPEGGVTMRSFIKCEEVRCISRARLKERRGIVDRVTMEHVEDRLKILLGLA